MNIYIEQHSYERLVYKPSDIRFHIADLECEAWGYSLNGRKHGIDEIVTIDRGDSLSIRLRAGRRDDYKIDAKACVIHLGSVTVMPSGEVIELGKVEFVREDD